MPIFISYRHSDTGLSARAIYERLRDVLQDDDIVLDVERPAPGKSISDKLRQAIARCDVVLVIIGPRWLEREANGQRRIDDPEDFVRLEVLMALSEPRIDVIPVLVEGAQMPRPSQLPPEMRSLGDTEGIEVSESRFDFDMGRLISAIGPAAVEPAPPQPPSSPAPQVRLDSVVTGDWVVEIRTPMGAVQLMDLHMDKGLLGRRRFHAGQKVGPPWSAEGSWEVLPEGQLVLKGTQAIQYPFPQGGPYEVYLTFSSVAPRHLEATTPVGERVVWQRAA